MFSMEEYLTEVYHCSTLVGLTDVDLYSKDHIGVNIYNIDEEDITVADIYSMEESLT